MDGKEKKWVLGSILCWLFITIGIITAHVASVWVGIMIVILFFGVWSRLAWWFMND